MRYVISASKEPPKKPSLARKKSISLCMIVRNEASGLERTLTSVTDLVSEIIVVDTGSTDETVTIAKRYATKVLNYRWENDFAKARNFSISHAKAEWILVLDGDEIISKESHQVISDLTSLGRDFAFVFTQRHYTNDPRINGFEVCKGEYPELESGIGGYFESSLVRLFPRHKKIYYSNRLHELVEPSLLALPHLRILYSGVRIHHYGHLKSDRTFKNELYLTLGKEKIADNPNDWKAHYELATELCMNGKFPESINYFFRSITLNQKYRDAWVGLGYTLGEVGRYEESLKAVTKALELDPHYPESYINYGVVLMRLRKYEESVLVFKRSLELNPRSVITLLNLGESYLQLRNFTESKKAFLLALEYQPENQKAKEFLDFLQKVLVNTNTATV
jgi:glycosyltransferase involved in cell wall biosynthesis